MGYFYGSQQGYCQFMLKEGKDSLKSHTSVSNSAKSCPCFNKSNATWNLENISWSSNPPNPLVQGNSNVGKQYWCPNTTVALLIANMKKLFGIPATHMDEACEAQISSLGKSIVWSIMAWTHPNRKYMMGQKPFVCTHWKHLSTLQHCGTALSMLEQEWK